MELLENFVKNLDATNFIIVIILTIVLTILCANYFKLCTFTEQPKKENFDIALVNQLNEQNCCQAQAALIQQCDCDIKNSQQQPQRVIPAKNENKKKQFKLSFYYSEGCGYCKMFKPEWAKLKETVSHSELNNILALDENDCNQNPEGCQANQQYIDGYPTVLLTKPCGTKVKYTDYPRTHDSVLKFLENNM